MIIIDNRINNRIDNRWWLFVAIVLISAVIVSILLGLIFVSMVVNEI